MKELRSWARGSVVGLLGRIGRIGASYGAAVIAARTFGVPWFGQLVVGLTVAQTLTVVGTFGIDDAYVRAQTRQGSVNGSGSSLEFNLERSSLTAILRSSALMASVIAVLVVSLRNREAWSWLLPFILTSIPLAVGMLIGAVAQMQDRQAFRAVSQEFGPSVCLLVAITIAALSSLSLQAVGLIYAALLIALIVAMAVRVLPPGQRAGASDVRWQAVLLSGAPFLIWRLGDSGLGWADVYALSVFRTNYDVGLYGAATRVAAISSIGLGAIASAVIPKIRDAIREGELLRAREWYFATIVLGVGMALVTVPLLLFDGRWVLGVLGGGFERASAPMSILVVAHVANAASGPGLFVASITTSRGKLVRLIAGVLLCDVLLLSLLVSPFGPIGAATATTVAMVVMNLALLVFAKRALGLRLELREGLMFVIAFVIAIGAGGAVTMRGSAIGNVWRAGGLVFAGMLGAGVLAALYLRRPGTRTLFRS